MCSICVKCKYAKIVPGLDVSINGNAQFVYKATCTSPYIANITYDYVINAMTCTSFVNKNKVNSLQ